MSTWKQESQVPQLSVELPTSLKATLDAETMQSGRSPSSVVTRALAQYLEQRMLHEVIGCARHAYAGATIALAAAILATPLASASAKDEAGVTTQYHHSRNAHLGRIYAGQVTLNAFGQVISKVGPIKPLSPKEKAALGEEVRDDLATADELIAQARAALQPKPAVDQAEATIESDFAPAAGANQSLRDIAASADQRRPTNLPRR